jgi:serine/threonine-protein kinase RsbW
MPRHPARPAPATTWEQTYPATPDQARALRAALGTLLASCPLADDVILLASELAANAITHSASGRPGGTFTIRVAHHHGHHIHADVTDQGSSWDGDLTATAGSPHGLYLLHALATRCGTTGGPGSRTVWFRLDYPTPAGPPQPGITTT